MAYRAYQPERRNKRRRWLLIILSVVAVVALIVVLVTRQTEQRGTVEFFAAADEATDLHSDASATMFKVISKIGPLLSRQEVTQMLNETSETAAAADEHLDIEVPPSVGTAYGTISSASAAWVSGTAEVERVILGIMDGEIVTAAEVVLQAALDELRVGDVGYQLFLEELATQPEDLMIPEFAEIHYIVTEPTHPLMYDAQNLVLRIQSAYNLAPRHNLSVVGVTVPEPVGDRGGIPLVPFSDTLGIHAVVSNIGNEEERNIAVALTVLNVDTNESFRNLTSIDSLVGGASTTAVFDDLPMTPGGLYQATVTVTIDEDNEPQNNSWSITFIWNEES